MLRRSFLLSIPTGIASALYGNWLQAKQNPMPLLPGKDLGPFMYASFHVRISLYSEEDSGTSGWGDRFYGPDLNGRALSIRDKLSRYLSMYHDLPVLRGRETYASDAELRVRTVGGWSSIQWSASSLQCLINSVESWLVQDILQVAGKTGSKLKVALFGDHPILKREMTNETTRLFDDRGKWIAGSIRSSDGPTISWCNLPCPDPA